MPPIRQRTLPQAQPFQQLQLKLEDLQQPGLPTLNAVLSQMFTQVSTLSGAAGKTPLPSGADVSGSTITNLGEPQSHADAISKGHAEANYSATAIAPQLESGSRNALKSYRVLNSQQQQEQYSNFLEGVLNTAPTANTSIITGGSPSGGSVVVTVAAGSHLFVSGNQVTYAQRSDTLALPASYSISSISRSANVVTVMLTSGGPFVVGEGIAVNGVTDTSFDGSFQLSAVSSSTLTWRQIGADSSSSHGSVAVSTTFYYTLAKNSQTLALLGPYASDTQQNRIAANYDQTVMIAVAVLNSAGLDTTQSSAGATPPIVTGGSRLQLRL